LGIKLLGKDPKKTAQSDDGSMRFPKLIIWLRRFMFAILELSLFYPWAYARLHRGQGRGDPAILGLIYRLVMVDQVALIGLLIWSILFLRSEPQLTRIGLGSMLFLFIALTFRKWFSP